MTDLAAQIREQLDAWAKPTTIIEFPEPLTEAQYADFVARFKGAQEDGPWKIRELPPSPFDLTRRALLAAIAHHDTHPSVCSELRDIAKALGIEVT